MRIFRAALCLVLLAVSAAGCSYFGRGRGGDVATGSVPQPRPQQTSESSAAPSLAAFEVTDLATGLTCTGNYQPLENSETFDAAVVCDDGRTGHVTATRSEDLSGTGTLALADGTAGTVALRRLAAETAEAPPTAKTQLPAPDPAAYVR